MQSAQRWTDGYSSQDLESAMENTTDTTAHDGDLVIPELADTSEQALVTAKAALEQAGYYAYHMIDDQQRWCVAADDEAGRIDIRIEGDMYLLQVCQTSPGLFIEEESSWRRQALERLARRVVQNVSNGLLATNQSARWNDDDQGVEVCIFQQIPFAQTDSISSVAGRALMQIDGLLTQVESQLRS
ncbi:hypothetical protein BH23CHL5_BH23CHL5_08490 [soil metagenome]